MAFYEVVAYSRTPSGTLNTPPTITELGRIVTLGGKSSGASGGLGWSRELCSEGFLTVTTEPTSMNSNVGDRLINLDTQPIELGLFRDGVHVYQGPVIAWQLEGTSVVIQSRSLLYYLRYMVLDVDKDYNQDQALIVKALIDHFQSTIFYGHFGLVTSGITSHGVTLERHYKRTELINMAKEIHALGESDNGFDVSYTPSTRAINLHNPQRGTDKSTTVFLDGRGITNPNIAVTIAADQFGTVSNVAGHTPDNASIWSQSIDATRQSQWGSAFITSVAMGVATQSELDSIAAQYLALSKDSLLIPSREFFEVTGAGLDDFEPGDKVTFDYDTGFGRLTVARDVKNQNVSVSPEGNEKLNIEFV